MRDTSRPDGTGTAQRKARLGGAIALLGLSAIGLIVSGVSTRDHVRFRTSGGTATGACAALAESGCRSAHASSAAELFGIPISHFASAFYLALASLAVLALVFHRRHVDNKAAGIPPLVTLSGTGAVLYSMFLATVLIRSGEACPFCIALYAVNAGVLGVGVAWWKGSSFRVEPARFWIPAVSAAALGGSFFATTTPILSSALTKSVVVSPGRAAVAAATSTARPALTLPATLPSKGLASAEDEIVEFSDLDCPHCALMHRAVSAAFKERGPSRLRVRFVNFPLDPVCNPKLTRSMHPTACLAARGALCAQEQDLFWQYVDAYFALPEPRSRELVLTTAEQVGVDIDRFAECIDSQQTARLLADNIALSIAAGVQATPTILVNGWTHEGTMTPEQLQKTLSETAPCGCDQRSSSGTCATASLSESKVTVARE